MLKDKLNVALSVINEELSVFKYVHKYKISVKEAREYKQWCRETYYYKSYKTPTYKPL